MNKGLSTLHPHWDFFNHRPFVAFFCRKCECLPSGVKMFWLRMGIPARTANTGVAAAFWGEC